MLQHRKRDIGFAICSSALAGYVDAIGFLSLGGFFVSFMSGNSTRLGVGIAGLSHDAVIAGQLIASFVAGAAAGTLVGKFTGERRRQAVLSAVAASLAAAAGLANLGFPGIAMLFVAFAMGAENATFERDGEVAIGLTYMTGTLVKLGQRIAGALSGGPKFAWAPYALLWCGLMAGAVAGALIWPYVGLAGLWAASLVALQLAGAAWLIDRRTDA